MNHPDDGSNREIGEGYALVSVGITFALTLAGFTLGGFWLGHLSALPPRLVALGLAAVWVGSAFPAVSALQSWYQGIIVHSRATRAVTESVAISLGVIVVLLGIGVALRRWDGLPVAMLALVTGNAAQVGWLRYRARAPLAALARAKA